LRHSRRLQAGEVTVDYVISLRSDANLQVSASDVTSRISTASAADFTQAIEAHAGSYTVTVLSKSSPEVTTETIPSGPSNDSPASAITSGTGRLAEVTLGHCFASALVMAAAALM